MGANRVEVSGCKNCPFCVAIVEGSWCQHPELFDKVLRIDRACYYQGKSPESCPLTEILIVKKANKK